MNLFLVGSAVVLVSWVVAPGALGSWELALALAAAILLGYARPGLGERVAAVLVLAAPGLLILLGT